MNRLLTLCLAAPEHLKLSYSELDDIDRTLGTRGRIVCLDAEGHEIEEILSTKPRDPSPFAKTDAPRAYSSMRSYLATVTDARVLIGGKALGLCWSNAWNRRRSDSCGCRPGIRSTCRQALGVRLPWWRNGCTSTI